MSDRRPTQELPIVRRYEAAGFRAWPASEVTYDGTWVIRLTSGHPARRLNSVNPLDPGDVTDIPNRISRVRERFLQYGRPLTFRMSPLSGSILSRHLDSQGWDAFSESLVMRLPLAGLRLDGAMDHIPMKDISRFMDAMQLVQGLSSDRREGMAQIIGSIRPETGLFTVEQDGRPVSCGICVHDGELAGLFEVATAEALRGSGFGRRVILSALKWARLRGAKEVWLQVEADNQAAMHVYRAIGFSEVYRYHYRRPPGR